MGKLKILVINNYHFRRGGADSIYFNTLDLLKSKGHEVEAFSLKHGQNLFNKNSHLFAEYHDMPQLNFFQKILSLKKYFYYGEAKKNLAKLLKEFNPDVVHAHLLYGGLTSSVLALLHKKNIPVVYSAHDYKLICPNQSFLINGSKVCEACKGRKYYNAAVKKCNRNNMLFSIVIALESYFRDIFFPISKHISVIVASSDFGLKKHLEFRPDFKTQITRLYNLAPNIEEIKPVFSYKSYFIFFGRLSSEKGVLTLLDAWKKLPPNIQLKIVGTGPQSSELANKVIEEKLSNVELLGYKVGDELIELIQKASFVVVPSEWYENNPMTVIEAFSYGKVGIGSNVGGIPELIIDGITGYSFEMGNPQKLADSIMKADSLSFEEYLTMSNNAREFALKNCASNIHYDQLMSIYNKAVNEKNIN